MLAVWTLEGEPLLLQELWLLELGSLCWSTCCCCGVLRACRGSCWCWCWSSGRSAPAWLNLDCAWAEPLLHVDGQARGCADLTRNPGVCCKGLLYAAVSWQQGVVCHLLPFVVYPHEAHSVGGGVGKQDEGTLPAVLRNQGAVAGL